ncbi:DNA alkylation repair protein [Candidatus Bathyarchaeota archaeon]|nr:DNA alkylation repair protein [Candidatus Bathyarchaeota archaeon]
MPELAERIKADVREAGSPERAEQLRRYFREPIETFGLSSQQTNDIAKKYYPEVKGDLGAAMRLTEELMMQVNVDYGAVGLRVLERFRRRIVPEHFPVLDGWVDYLDNWATTDQLCTKIISEAVRKDPGLIERLLEWTGSGDRWRRRAAAVSLVPIARRGEQLGDVFRVADRLMTDGDDMVQKGVGWMLKEASKRHPEEVREYLLRWRSRSPALILRYASEKLPSGMRVLKTRA